jgi:starch-binding outer membrane protein, SusD/RagB family
MKKRLISYFFVALVSLIGFTGCQGMFDLNSEQVVFAEDNDLDSPTDTVYSLIGILNTMQKVADRTVLLGEIRGDLVSLTSSADVQLQALANFTADADNDYNAPEDYYAIINNCNYFIANADTSLKKRNISVFLKEYALVKVIRAWTYLQLAQIYGSVPFVTEPILTEEQAEKDYDPKDIQAIAEYFIDDLVPYINTDLPGYLSSEIVLPIRVLLGDLCLWAGRYTEAATYYHDYLTDATAPLPTLSSRVRWSTQTNTFDGYPSDSYSGIFSSTEMLTYIAMETSSFYGIVCELDDVFNSTNDNLYYYQASYSSAYKALSKSQSNCKVYVNSTTSTRDTMYAPSENSISDLYVGDLRLSSICYHQTVSNSSLNTYSTSYQSIAKIGSNVCLYRRGLIYLRYAEAMNRAGFPTAAFAVLKYGLTSSTITPEYIDSSEINSAAGTTLLTWNSSYFTSSNTIGIHARGCGDAAADKYYVIPALASRADTIDYVEDLICDEMALETSFEGYRFYDLMRIAMRREDNSYLANKIASRNGSANFDQSLYETLMNSQNWYLPLE